MHRHRIAVAQPQQHYASRLRQCGDRRAELHRIDLLYPAGEIGHFLLTVPRQQRIALHRIAAVGQRHATLAQGAQLIAHGAVVGVAQPFEQAADRGFGNAAQARQLGAVVTDQIVIVIENEVGHPLLLWRQLWVVAAQAFVEPLHYRSRCNLRFSGT